MENSIITSSLFIRNRKKFQARLSEDKAVIIRSASRKIRNSDNYYPYRQSSSFYYLTGINIPNTILYMDKDREVLFIPKPNKEEEIWNGKMMDEYEASRLSGIKEIEYLETFEIFLKSLSFSIINEEDEEFMDIITGLRLIKEEEEILAIRKAAVITKDCFMEIKVSLRPNLMEYDIEAIMNYEFTKAGASGHSFHPIIASGKNATYLHYNNNDSRLRDGDLLLLDFGAEYSNYASDLSMTIPINGEYTAYQALLYNKVLEIHNIMKKEIVVGTTIAELNRRAVELMKEVCLSLELISPYELKANPEAYKRYYPHGLSHFIGLDVHDLGSRETRLENNMVLSCEPGLYIPEKGVGIRIETDVIVNELSPIDIFGEDFFLYSQNCW